MVQILEGLTMDYVKYVTLYKEDPVEFEKEYKKLSLENRCLILDHLIEKALAQPNSDTKQIETLMLLDETIDTLREIKKVKGLTFKQRIALGKLKLVKASLKSMMKRVKKSNKKSLFQRNDKGVKGDKRT